MIGLAAGAMIAAAALAVLPLQPAVAVALSQPVSAEPAGWRDALISHLQPGDVVFRRGIGDISEAIAAMQGFVRRQSTTWSHVGVVTQIRPDGPLYIVHAIDRGVVLETPTQFFGLTEASAGTRIQGNKTTEAAAQAATRYLGRSFDDDFSLSDNGERMYCTELFVVAMRDAGASVKIEPRKVLMISDPVIMPDDLFAALETLLPKN
ncbi:YiiX/YebB-like N1pC/P60 family cysteine hydrolase [Azonexus sp.]|uniref:YiiX/YebB-like N1pC/P60 family cysteine hydrolase n=1 Tax=Azonexus sp. TaxID=1872668 RepID=UPI0039E4C16F